jgi:flagella basal body P-ring formation protein FlgA
VQRAAVVAPALVRRGGAVTVVAVGAGLRITQSGVAQHDAKLGESVRVTAPSGQVIQGFVVAAGTVHVQLGGGAP